jgi:predicted nucleic acid-binding protein
MITLAELAAGPDLATPSYESTRRQARLQQLAATFAPISPSTPLQLAATGRSLPRWSRWSHRRRIADLLIASTAHANGVAFSSRHPDDFAGLSDLVDVVGI